MDRLEIPFEFAGSRFKRHDGIAEEVVSFSIETVIITGRAAEDGVENASLRVYRHVEAPIVCACSILPPIAWPRVVARFAWLRNRMEFPNLCACACIECTRVARRAGGWLFADVCADE